MNRHLVAVLALTAWLPAAGLAQAPARPPVNLKIGSWNTMLQPWFTNEPDVIRTIADTKFDVLALQSVWTEEAKTRILADPVISKRYPYSFYTPAYQRPAGIDLEDPIMDYLAQNYVNCLIAYGVNTQQLLQPNLPVPLDCMYLRIGIGIHNYNPANQVSAACLDNAMQELPLNRAFDSVGICGSGRGVQSAHGGRPGQLILSRLPMSNLQTVPFESVRERRMNVHVNIAGLNIVFGHWAANSLKDIDPYLAPLQYGNSAVDMANTAINGGYDIVVGTVNSGLDYQREAHDTLLANGFRPLFSEPTYCPAATHGSFPQCAMNPGPRSVDNIYVGARLSTNCRTETFATQPISDHVGISASCLFTFK